MIANRRTLGLRGALFILLGSGGAFAQTEQTTDRNEWDAARRLAAGLDPALVELRSCLHSVTNATWAPASADQAARDCHEREASVKDSNLKLKGSVKQCYMYADRAFALLHAANDKYQQARRALEPEQGRLVHEAQALHKQADDEAMKCSQCEADATKLAMQLGQALVDMLQAALERDRVQGPAAGGPPTRPNVPGAGNATNNNPSGSPRSGGTSGGRGSGPANGSRSKPGGPSFSTPDCVAASDSARQQLASRPTSSRRR